MASPHVAGVGALFLEKHPTAPLNGERLAGTVGTIVLHATSVMNGTPNRLLYTKW